ncbi:hypothetical protein ACB092_04G164000 [Castanea dentata]
MIGLLIGFGRGFRAEFWWWIMVGSVWSGGFAWCFPWWLCDVVVVGCVVDGGSVGDGVVDGGSVGGDWKFWVDRWVEILMVGYVFMLGLFGVWAEFMCWVFFFFFDKLCWGFGSSW